MSATPSDRFPAAALHFGPFTFDGRSRLLLCNGVPRHLSPKAHELLRVLIESRPRAVSRQELFDALWPSTFVVETNLASVMNEVRRALSDDPRQPRYIRTVHSYGYAFCSEPGEQRAAFALSSDGHLYPLMKGENIVGRSEDVRVLLADSTVSRRHAKITIEADEIWIEDLGSKNGTFVDEIAVRGPTRIHRNSILVFGIVGAKIVRSPLSGATTSAPKLDMSLVRELMDQPTSA